LVAGAVLAALPALAGGLLPWLGGRTEAPFAVRVPGVTLPSGQVPDQAPTDNDVAAGPAAEPRQQPGRGSNDSRDRDGGGSGRSGGGGGDSGGSSGPG
jgi:hypothetical protein